MGNCVAPKPKHQEHQAPKPSIMSISRDSPEPFGASWATANCVAQKPKHHEHQLGSPGNLVLQIPSIMSIRRDSPEPFGTSWATAQFLGDCVAQTPARKPQHHEHQPGHPRAFRSIMGNGPVFGQLRRPEAQASGASGPKAQHHEHQPGQLRPSFWATALPKSPSIMSISREALATLCSIAPAS